MAAGGPLPPNSPPSNSQRGERRHETLRSRFGRWLTNCVPLLPFASGTRRARNGPSEGYGARRQQTQIRIVTYAASSEPSRGIRNGSAQSPSAPSKAGASTPPIVEPVTTLSGGSAGGGSAGRGACSSANGSAGMMPPAAAARDKGGEIGSDHAPTEAAASAAGHAGGGGSTHALVHVVTREILFSISSVIRALSPRTAVLGSRAGQRRQRGS